MRRLLPLVLLALAACQVDVEGAPCRGLGQATEDCPGGQGCGLDQRCSKRAAASSCALCTPDAVRCKPLQPGATAPGEPGKIQQCDATGDPVCGAWVTRTTCAEGLVCGEKSGAPSCECPANGGPEFAADPAGSRTVDAAPYPTGVSSPPACRFGRLGDAVAAAAAHGAGAIARAYGTFGVAETSEVLPLSVPTTVRLSGPDAPAAHAVLRLESGTAIGVDLQGAIEGLDVENVSSTGIAVATSCGETGKPSLKDVAVSGAGQLTNGIRVGGACGAVLEGTQVRKAAEAALLVDAAAEAPVEVIGGGFRESGVGLEVRGGRVTLHGPQDAVHQLLVGFTSETLEIDANIGNGIALVGKETPIVLDAARVRVTNNDGTALRMDALPPGSAVSVADSELSGNKATAQGSRYASGRSAGGVIVNQLLPLLSFSGNTVACNGGDQVGIYVVGAVDLAPDACGASSNFFRTRVGAAAVYVSPYATVDASNNYWAPDPPGYIGTGFALGDTCQPATPPPACP